MWERRYHFPETARTLGGHRQYIQQDVLTLEWVKLQMDGGMRAGRAIRARHHISQQDAVTAALHEALPQDRLSDPNLVAVQPVLLDALLEYDGARAKTLMEEAVARHSLQSVVLDLIGPTLAAIGESWSHGEVEVSTEHFATNFLRHQLLLWMRASPPPFDVRPIALVCAPEELHEGSLLMLGALLRELRWPITYLGQSLPLSNLATLVERVRPALMVFVAMSEATARALVDWPTWLPEASETQTPLVGYGGRAFTENPLLADLVPGTLLVGSLTKAASVFIGLCFILMCSICRKAQEPTDAIIAAATKRYSPGCQ